MKQIKLLLVFCMLSLQYSVSAMQKFKKVAFPKSFFAKRYFSASTKKSIDLERLANLGQSIEDDVIQEPMKLKESSKSGKKIKEKIKTKCLGFFSLYTNYTQKVNDSIVEIVEDIDSIVPKQPGKKIKETIKTKYNDFAKKSNDFVVEIVEDIDSIVPKQPGKKIKETIKTKYNNFAKKSNDFVVEVLEDIDSVVPKQPVKKTLKKVLKKINKML